MGDGAATSRAAEPFGLDRIGQIAIRARELDASVAFYRDTLGMRFLFRTPTLAFFQCGGVRLMLAVAESAAVDHPASIVYYQVDDLAEAHRQLVARGVAFTSDPHLIARLPDREVWMAFFEDVAGNLLGLMSEIPVSQVG
jgi:methylmalonyl-CoA/ethylmalonyl-CoA epimerase